jgi:LmbE family N-acetylglucosaminyl deacetylase
VNALRRGGRLELPRARRTLLLSPHFDDAVLDFWSVLTRRGRLTVANVFAGVPSRPCLTEWDAECGAADSGEWTRRRIVEDAQALALARRAPVNMPLLQTSTSIALGERPPVLDEVVAAVEPLARRVATIHAPAALGGHPDHVLVRDAALRMAAAGRRVRLYADLPYAVRAGGWPTWLAGDDGVEAADADWEGLLEAAGLLREQARAVQLADEQVRAKLAALRTYETQFRYLDGQSHRISRSEVLRLEVFWEVGGRRRTWSRTDARLLRRG